MYSFVTADLVRVEPRVKVSGKHVDVNQHNKYHQKKQDNRVQYHPQQIQVGALAALLAAYQNGQSLLAAPANKAISGGLAHFALHVQACTAIGTITIPSGTIMRRKRAISTINPPSPVVIFDIDLTFFWLTMRYP